MNGQTGPSGPQQAIFVFFVLTIALIGFWKLRPAPKPEVAHDHGGQFQGLRLRPADPQLRQIAENIAKGQLDAIRKGDYEKATDYDVINASSFGPARARMADQFHQFIQVQYPAFISQKSVKFGNALTDVTKNTLWLDFMLTDKSGHTFLGTYKMTMNTGRYRIYDIGPFRPRPRVQ